MDLVGLIPSFEATCFCVVNSTHRIRKDASADSPQVELTTTGDKARSVEGPQIWNSQLEIWPNPSLATFWT